MTTLIVVAEHMSHMYDRAIINRNEFNAISITFVFQKKLKRPRYALLVSVNSKITKLIISLSPFLIAKHVLHFRIYYMYKDHAVAQNRLAGFHGLHETTNQKAIC